MSTPKKNKLKAGVIGLGIGEMHAEIYDAHPDVDLAMICDIDLDRLNVIQSKHPHTQASTHAHEIIENTDIDIISICSYDNDHAKQIIAATNNKKHIFVEKPLCLTDHELTEIQTALKQNPRTQLSSNFVLRTFPIFKELKEKIINNELGNIYAIEGDYNYGRLHKLESGWRGQIPYYSVSHGGGIHLIDLMLWLTNDKPKKVCSIATNIASQTSQFKGNDTISSIIEFSSGAVGKVCSNYASVGPHHHCLKIYGTNGTFVYDGIQAYYYFQRDNKKVPPERHISKLPLKSNRQEKGEILNSFIEQLLIRGTAQVSATEVIENMKISLAIEKSLVSGIWETILYI